MDKFDFNAPINTTVIYDDSDDETNATINNLQIAEDTTNNILESKENSKIQETCLLKHGDNLKRKETTIKIKISKAHNTTKFEIVKNNQCKNNAAENIKRNEKETESEIFTTIEKKKEAQQKPLDMPCLEEDYFNILDIPLTGHEDNNKESDANNTITDKTACKNKRKISSNENCKPKRRLTKEINFNIDIPRIGQDSGIHKTYNNQNFLLNCNESQTNTNISSPSNYYQCTRDMSEARKSNTQSATHRVDGTQINLYSVISQKEPNINISSLQTQNEVNDTVSNYIKENLNLVSEHMIFIIYSYHAYTIINKSNIEHSLIEYAKNNFIRTKNHFFDVSYSSVANIILPRENDKYFLKTFIEYTIKLSNSKSYPYSYAQIEPLFYEMVEWVKRRQKQIENLNLNKVSSPLLSQQLNKPAQTLDIPLSAYPNQCQQVRLTDNNTYGSYLTNTTERIINIESSRLNTENIQRKPCSSVIPPAQNAERYYSNQMHNTLSNQNSTNTISYTHQTPLSKIRSFLEDILPPVAKQITQVHNKKSTKTQQKQSKQVQSIPVTPVWQNQATHSWEYPESQISQAFLTEAPQSWQIDAPTAQASARNVLDQLHHKQLPIQHTNDYFRTENPSQNEVNRSISRDSGFMSPLNFSSGTDQLDNTPMQEQGAQTTPLITHVTSLNPNVSYILEGFCTVCGKTTKKKCLGCYKCYYCSHSCQLLDWKNHMAVCK